MSSEEADLKYSPKCYVFTELKGRLKPCHSQKVIFFNTIIENCLRGILEAAGTTSCTVHTQVWRECRGGGGQHTGQLCSSLSLALPEHGLFQAWPTCEQKLPLTLSYLKLHSGFAAGARRGPQNTSLVRHKPDLNPGFSVVKCKSIVLLTQ